MMDILPEAAKELNPSNIRAAYQECKQMFGDNLQKVPRIAHEAVLETDYLQVNSRKLARIEQAFKLKYPKLPIESLQGKLELKMPQIKYPDGLTNFEKEEIRHTIAAIYIELLIDNERVDVEVKTTGAGKLTRHRTEVILGGTADEKDLLEGLCMEPGQMIQTHVGHQRLNAEFKWTLSRLGSMPFKLSDWYSPDLLRRFYHLSAEYNSESNSEKRVKRHFRHDNDYMQAVDKLADLERFYLPMFFDDRGRMYYYFSKLFGVRPGGKLFETLMIDRAEPKLLSEKAVDHIKHIIYTVLHGKYSVEHAVKHFNAKTLQQAKDADPLAVEVPDVPYKGNERVYRHAESEFAERVLLNKCAHALELYAAGEPCSYMFGKDLTNSGLIMAANSFRSEKMLRGANMYGLKTVADSHSQFGKAQEIDHLPRSEVKSIHTPLLHGSSARAIARMISDHLGEGKDVTEEDVHQHNIDAYGAEVDNIETIAAWGELMVNNHRNILKWKMPDGFPASHRSVMVRTPFNVYAASTRVKSKPFKEYKLMATMPIALGADGKCVFGRENTTVLSDKGVGVKTRGLFANITHSIDAMLLRKVIGVLLDSEEVFLLKHDDYMVSPDMFDEVIATAQEFFDYLQSGNLYQEILDQIAEKYGTHAPRLLVGNAPNRVAESFNFLMV